MKLECHSCQVIMPPRLIEPHTITCGVQRYGCEGYEIPSSRKSWIAKIFIRPADSSLRFHHSQFLLRLAKDNNSTYLADYALSGSFSYNFAHFASVLWYVRKTLREYELHP